MPKGFDMCRKKGGKIRIVKSNSTSYTPVCYLGKKSFRGYTHKIKDNNGNVADAIKERKS